MTMMMNQLVTDILPHSRPSCNQIYCVNCCVGNYIGVNEGKVDATTIGSTSITLGETFRRLTSAHKQLSQYEAEWLPTEQRMIMARTALTNHIDVINNGVIQWQSSVSSLEGRLAAIQSSLLHAKHHHHSQRMIGQKHQHDVMARANSLLHTTELHHSDDDSMNNGIPLSWCDRSTQTGSGEHGYTPYVEPGGLFSSISCHHSSHLSCHLCLVLCCCWSVLHVDRLQATVTINEWHRWWWRCKSGTIGTRQITSTHTCYHLHQQIIVNRACHPEWYW
jgi:hypothetical protein